MTHEEQPRPENEESQPGANPEHAEYEHPEIWIGSLADYNNGDLHGDWMDAARKPEEIHADIQRILASGPAARRGETPEEWGIFDHQGFGPLQLGEYERIEEVSRLAQAIATHGPAFAVFANDRVCDSEEATVERFRESYLGRYDSVVDYARQLASDLGFDDALDELRRDVRSYAKIDYELFAHDLQFGGDIIYAHSDEGGIYIFRND
ncbi:antirestriction protein ArdA [uncultured Friedmanniella sp.]|uniref:antirestriction protein ArdA n=1 Tax=uncultured Friedmanniella sp. TaxID=335381 RepID=UPI0035CAD4DA